MSGARYSMDITWECTSCNDQECIPIRSESRCLCGHKRKVCLRSTHSLFGPFSLFVSFAYACIKLDGKECVSPLVAKHSGMSLRNAVQCNACFGFLSPYHCFVCTQEHAGVDCNFRCMNTSCTCPSFYFIVAQGAWVLRLVPFCNWCGSM